MNRRHNENHHPTMGDMHDPAPAPAQGQAELQAQLQAELQGQLQHQGEHQGQNQGQDQDQESTQDQSQSQDSWNGNVNKNESSSSNDNSNGNTNKSANANANENHNDSTNTNTNTNESTTTVDVHVGVDLGLDGFVPDDNDMIDLDLNQASMGDFLVAKGNLHYDPGNDIDIGNILNGSLNGAGNDSGQVFTQSNNLYDNDTLNGPSLSNDSSFSVTGTVSGGSASAGDGIGTGGGSDMGAPPYGVMGSSYDHDEWDNHDDNAPVAGNTGGSWGSGNGDDGSVAGTSYAAADAAMSVSAFNQNIVMGANILGNTIDTTVVGGGMSTDYSIGDDQSA